MTSLGNCREFSGKRQRSVLNEHPENSLGIYRENVWDFPEKLDADGGIKRKIQRLFPENSLGNYREKALGFLALIFSKKKPRDNFH
jgi:hypothetical protein